MLIFLGILGWVLAVTFFYVVTMGRPSDWTRVSVEDPNRGPNADTVYRGIRLCGQPYLFTQEQTDVANKRGLKHWK